MQDFEALRQRFIDIQDYTGLKNEEFGDICGISHVSIGNITGGKSKGFDVSIVTKILEKYPEISGEWFLMGIGDMIKSTGLSGSDLQRLRDLEKENQRLEEEIGALRIKYNRNNEKLIIMQDNVIAMQEEINKLRRQK